MKETITSAAAVPAAIVEAAWQEVGASFERFCLTAGIATLTDMMDEDAARLCGPRYGRAEGKAGHRWGKTKGKVGFSIAARVKTRLGYLMLSPFFALLRFD
jgi:putative transposase